MTTQEVRQAVAGVDASLRRLLVLVTLPGRDGLSEYRQAKALPCLAAALRLVREASKAIGQEKGV